jgi:hypothetical protein
MIQEEDGQPRNMLDPHGMSFHDYEHAREAGSKH